MPWRSGDVTTAGNLKKSQPDNPERLGPGNTRVPGPTSAGYVRREQQNVQNETKTLKNVVTLASNDTTGFFNPAQNSCTSEVHSTLFA